MSYLSDVIANVRRFISTDKEAVVMNLAKSATNSLMLPEYNSVGYGDAFNNSGLSTYLQMESDLLQRYADYELMNETPEISSALDIYADDATSIDYTLNRSVWVTSEDKRVQEILDDLLQKTLRIDEEIWEIARNLCMYGSDFHEILYSEQGVIGLNFIPTPTARRIEGIRGELHGYIQDFRSTKSYSPTDFYQLLQQRRETFGVTKANTIQGSENLPFEFTQAIALEPHEVVNFRLKGSVGIKTVYGVSILENSRAVCKRLVLLEDAALIYRLQRAPERFAYTVDIGNTPADEVPAALNKFKQHLKKKKFINPSNNLVDLKANLLEPDADIFLGSRNGVDAARVQVLTAPVWQSMIDVEYFQNKQYAGMKIPKMFLGQADGSLPKNLSSIDQRFARTIMRVQRELINGLEKVCRMHLAAIGWNPNLVNFEVHMCTPSSILEMSQMEIKNVQAALGNALRSNVSQYYVLKNILKVPESEIEGIFKQQEDEQLRMMSIQLKGQQKMQDMQMQAQAQQMQMAQQMQAQMPPQQGAPQQGMQPMGMMQQPSQQQQQPTQLQSHFNNFSTHITPLHDDNKFISDKLEKLKKDNVSLSKQLTEVSNTLRALQETESLKYSRHGK